MKGKKIVCLVCILAVILIPTAYEATENGLSQSVQRKQLAIIEEMESKTAVNLFSDMGVNRASEEWELYSIDGERDEYKDKSTGRKTYLFVKDKPILHGMIDYQNFDSSPSEESLKTEEELIEIAKSHLNAAFGEDFIKYRYSEITYDGFSNTYEVYFRRYVNGYRVDDTMHAALTPDGRLAAYIAGAHDRYETILHLIRRRWRRRKRSCCRLHRSDGTVPLRTMSCI